MFFDMGLHYVLKNSSHSHRTALHYACAHGHLGVVTLLIERNCNVNARDDDKCTPLIKVERQWPTISV